MIKYAGPVFLPFPTDPSLLEPLELDHTEMGKETALP
jgi:hypothetical protein